MANLFIAILASMALAFAWKKMWRKSLLDDSRDRLFDLRDEARQWFIDNEYELDHHVYQSLRNILNAHIRHTEDLTITRYIVTTNMVKNSASCREYIDDHLNASFWTEDKKIKDYVTEVRAKASMIVIDHMVKGSFALSLAAFCIMPIMFIWIIGRALFLALRDCRWVTLGIRRTTVLASIAALLFLLPYRALTVHPGVARYFGQEQIEIYSTRS